MHRLEGGVLLEGLPFLGGKQNIVKSPSMSIHEACILCLWSWFFFFNWFSIGFRSYSSTTVQRISAHAFKKCLHSAMHAGVYFR